MILPLRNSILIALPLFLILSSGATGQEKKNSNAQEEPKKNSDPYHEAFYRAEQVNAGLQKLKKPVDLQTPLGAVESFMNSCRAEDFERAAHALNLKFIPKQQQPDKGPELARKFHYVLQQKIWLDWDSLPDRPDGQLDQEVGNNPLAGKPRRSIRLGEIRVDGRPAVLRVQRVKPKEGEPIWLFSPHTVEKIEPLYAAYGPSFLDRQLPGWLKVRVLGNVPLWEWVALIIAVAIGVAAGWLVQKCATLAAKRSPSERIDGLIETLRVPIAVAVCACIIYLAQTMMLSLTGPVSYVLDPIVLIILVGSITWIVLRTLKYFSVMLIREYVDDFEEDRQTERKRILTQLSVGRRVVTLIAVCIATGIILIQLNLAEILGFSLLASAGVLTVILGIAGQTVLGNLMAGLQLAITQPVKIGDTVIFEGEWGSVEQIAFSYLVIRTWDQRRVVVPLQYFISHPVQNWSMNNTHLIKPIHLYVDYRLDVQRVRDKFAELLKEDDDWDGEQEPKVQVTGANDETMEVRALCSAKNGSVAWDLHCRLREQMIAYIQSLEHGKYLPRRRVDLLDEQHAQKSEKEQASVDGNSYILEG